VSQATAQLPVQLVFEGAPFDGAAVLHTLRHLAMRVGWRFVRDSPHRLVYLTRASQEQREGASARSVVVLSDPGVKLHLGGEAKPIPLSPGDLLPFPQRSSPRPGSIAADVVAGAHACMNLWYERRADRAGEDGWILYEQDWMAHAGLSEPLPVADMWLDRIYEASLQIGWPATRRRRRAAVALSHDVDYLPGRSGFGLPRLARAIVRQCVHRRRPLDAVRIATRYLASLANGQRPYDEIARVVAEEQHRGATSSFQFVVARGHDADPAYAAGDLAGTLIPPDWEVCLHGSYRAARGRGAVAAEKARLEALLRRPVSGYRQHYLNFEPSALFREVADAGLAYDMSVGYNDRSGPRAGTYFPYKPYDLDAKRAYGPWEIPFVLMDTTLATTHRLSAQQAVAHARRALEPVVAAQGCVSIIWHQEQCGGLLDPGYDQVYLAVMDGLIAEGVALGTGAALLPEWQAAWERTMPEGVELPVP
jgi:hypothetical protein